MHKKVMHLLCAYGILLACLVCMLMHTHQHSCCACATAEAIVELSFAGPRRLRTTLGQAVVSFTIASAVAQAQH